MSISNETTERTHKEALAYIALGTRMLGWQIMVPKGDEVDYVLIANKNGAERLKNKLEALERP